MEPVFCSARRDGAAGLATAYPVAEHALGPSRVETLKKIALNKSNNFPKCRIPSCCLGIWMKSTFSSIVVLPRENLTGFLFLAEEALASRGNRDRFTPEGFTEYTSFTSRSRAHNVVSRSWQKIEIIKETGGIGRNIGRKSYILCYGKDRVVQKVPTSCEDTKAAFCEIAPAIHASGASIIDLIGKPPSRLVQLTSTRPFAVIAFV